MAPQKTSGTASQKDKQILIAEKLRAEDVSRHANQLLNTCISTIQEKATLIEYLKTELID